MAARKHTIAGRCPYSLTAHQITNLSHTGESKSDLLAYVVLLSRPSKPVPVAAPLQTARTANASWPVPRPPGQHPRVPGPVGLESPPPQRGYPEGLGYVCERKKDS